MSSGERLTLLCFNALFAKWCLICFYALRGLWGCMWGTWKLLPWEPDKEIFQQPTWDPDVMSLVAQRHGDALRVQRVPGGIRLAAPCPEVCLPPQQWERFLGHKCKPQPSLGPLFLWWLYSHSSCIRYVREYISEQSCPDSFVELWSMLSFKPFLITLMPSSSSPCGSTLQNLLLAG